MPKVPLTVRIDPRARIALRNWAALKKRRPVSEILRAALSDVLDEALQFEAKRGVDQEEGTSRRSGFLAPRGHSVWSRPRELADDPIPPDDL